MFRSRRRRVRAKFVVLVLLAALVVPLAPHATATDAVRTSAAANGSVTVSWTFATDPLRSNFVIWTADSTTSIASFWGVQRVSPDATTATIGGLLPGRTYTITVSSSGGGATSGASASTTVTMPAGGCGSTVSQCVSVDTASSLPAGTRMAQGILHGVTAQTPASLLTPLATTAWRIAPLDGARFSAARSAGGSVTVLLSDGWLLNNWSGSHVARNPWDDWTAYTNTIKWIVQWHINAGLVPDYWEIQNEPDDARYYNPATPPTRALVLQQLRVADTAIKSVLPSAKVAGPSLGSAFVDSGSLMDFSSALSDFAAHGLQYDAITWHEIGAGRAPRDFEASARSIAEHVGWVRTLLAQHPTLGNPPLIVGEYGAAFAQNVPGAEVGYMGALARNGVAAAVHSCWPVAAPDGSMVDTCFDRRGLLDGLVTLDGRASPAWWVHREYASMSGTVVYADGNQPTLAAEATVATSGEVDVLVGRDTGCDPKIGVWCPADSIVPGPAVPTMAVRLRGGSPSTFKITVDRIPLQAGALDAPTRVTVSPHAHAVNGMVTFTLPTMAGGDAAFVRLIPAS